ncbi:hypothetical protein [Nostoc sp.]|uniref:hypothetical protein n=1 Tax=Nostoc sp. TaxID=1180 RepID=UPI002FFA7B69
MHSQSQQIHTSIIPYNPRPTINSIPTKLAKVNGNVGLYSSYAKIYSPSVEGRGASANSKVEPLNLNVEPLNSKVEPLNLNVEPLNSKVEPLNSKVEP